MLLNFFTTLSLSISFLARTGVCIQCDAGMCKSFFHVSCAHAAGFLSEPIYTVDHAHVGEPQSDAYLAHCKLHSDRAVVKKRRRAFLTHLVTSRKRREEIIQRRKGFKHKSIEILTFCTNLKTNFVESVFLMS